MLIDEVGVADVLMYLVASVTLIAVITVVIVVLFYALRASRAAVHYASRRWWRW